MVDDGDDRAVVDLAPTRGMVPVPADEPPRVVCSWCSVVMREGSVPSSHGICKGCFDRVMTEEGATVMVQVYGDGTPTSGRTP